MDMQRVGARLRELRGRMTQKDLAARADVAINVVQDIERGKCWPTFPVACALADVLGVSLDELRKEPANVEKKMGRPKKKPDAS